MNVLPGLYLIEGKRSNVYLWEGENGFILIDAGSPGDDKRILNYLEKIGHQPSAVKAILITHADIDHAGSAAVLQAYSGATVYAGAETSKLLAQGKSPEHMPRLVQFVLDHFMAYKPVASQFIQDVADGDTLDELRDLRILATPGHTMGHHSFCSDVHGILFAGDALNTRGNKLQNTPKRISADYGLACQSAMKLLRLHPAVFACGHGRPFQNHDANEIMTLHRQLKELVAR